MCDCHNCNARAKVVAKQQQLDNDILEKKITEGEYLKKCAITKKLYENLESNCILANQQDDDDDDFVEEIIIEDIVVRRVNHHETWGNYVDLSVRPLSKAAAELYEFKEKMMGKTVYVDIRENVYCEGDRRDEPHEFKYIKYNYSNDNFTLKDMYL
jgi:hypothetical protein